MPALTVANTSLQQQLQEDGERLSGIKEYVTNAAKKGVKLQVSSNYANVQEAVAAFKKFVAQPYIRSLLKALANRFPSLPVIDALSIFQPNLCRKLKQRDLASCGNEKLLTLMKTASVLV